MPELIAYQDAAYARQYVDFVAPRGARWRRSERPGARGLAEAVARHLFKLMAYKDEYEVARLHLDAALAGRAPRAVRPRRSATTGTCTRRCSARSASRRRSSSAPGSRPPSARCTRMKGLRGTALDPFGYAEVRRVERALIGEYRALVETALVAARPRHPRRGGGAGRAARHDPRLRGHQARQREAVPASAGQASSIAQLTQPADPGGHSTVRRLLLVGVAVALAGCASMTAENPAPAVGGGGRSRTRTASRSGVATLIETAGGRADRGDRLPAPARAARACTSTRSGVCEPPDFTSAGAHFNPAGKKHGRMNPEGPHAGDLPNLVVAAVGRGRHRRHHQGRHARARAQLAPRRQAAPRSSCTPLPTTTKTDPTGNSGGRIACGVITK